MITVSALAGVEVTAGTAKPNAAAAALIQKMTARELSSHEVSAVSIEADQMEELWPSAGLYAKRRADRGTTWTQTPPFGRSVIDGIG